MLTEKIRATVATDKRFRELTFRFNRQEQRILGQFVMRHTAENLGAHFETIPPFQFKHGLDYPPFKEMPSINMTLEDFRRAKCAADLKGSDRLEEIQSLLVDLLEYLEGKEGFTLYTRSGKREKAVDYGSKIE